MSVARRQAQIEAPVGAVWDLLGDPNRYPEWWPRCLDTGTYMRWVVMDARSGTFLDLEFGMDPKRLQHKVFDVLAGRRFYSRWLEQSLEGLRRAAAETAPRAEN